MTLKEKTEEEIIKTNNFINDIIATFCGIFGILTIITLCVLACAGHTTLFIGFLTLAISCLMLSYFIVYGYHRDWWI